MEHPGTILIVDDSPNDQKTLEALLVNQGYSLVFASNGMDALRQAALVRPDLVLTDAMMPGIDGFELCRRLRSDLVLSEVSIIMITGLDDRESRLQGIEAGADDFLTKPFDSAILRSRVKTILRLNRYRSLLSERTRFERLFDSLPDGAMVVSPEGIILAANPAVCWMLGKSAEGQVLVGQSFLDYVQPSQVEFCQLWLNRVTESDSQVLRVDIEMVRQDGSAFFVDATIGSIVWEGVLSAQFSLRDVSERKKAEQMLERSHDELEQSFDATLVGLVRMIDTRNKETEGHTYRVSEMTLRLARAMGVQGPALEYMRRGALLHDVGKLMIPDSILFKTGTLSDDEWEVIRKHPEYAYEWLYPIKYLRPSLDIPYCHHEKWDGTGYPRGLYGDEIPLAARLFAVVDVWESLRSERLYRAAWPEERVRDHLRFLAGSHFEPAIVETFLLLNIPFGEAE